MPGSRVIIVGAGAAGLMAAHELASSGVNAILLEARDRVGGRIHTRRVPDMRRPLELGAEFVHGRPKQTWEIIRAANLTVYDVSEEHWHLHRGRAQHLHDFWERVAHVMSPLKRLRRDLSFAEFLTTRARGSPDAKTLAASFVEGFDAADLNVISAQSLADEQETLESDEDKQFRLAEGQDALLGHLITTDSETRLRTMVESIRWRRRRAEISVRSPGGKRATIDASQVILTLPIALLASRAVRFDPPLPRLTRQAIAQIASGPVVKIVLNFREPFWEELHRGKFRDMSFLHERGSPVPTWWTMLPLRTTILTGWAGGPAASKLAGRGQRAIIETAIGAISKMLRIPVRRTRAMLRSSHAYDWQSDPFARGAYSYLRIGGLEAREHLARPIEQTLFFAGEATDTSGQAATVAGALASGRRAARQLLRVL